MAELTVRAGFCCDGCIEDGDAIGCAHAPVDQQRPVLEIALDEYVIYEDDEDLFSPPPPGGDFFNGTQEMIDSKMTWRLVDGTITSW